MSPLYEGSGVVASDATRTQQILPSPQPSEPYVASNATSSPKPTTISRRSLPVNATPGFLGSTSYAAVFEESQDAIITDIECDSTRPPRDLCVEIETADTEMINEGARVLSRFCELFPALSETYHQGQPPETVVALSPVMFACADAVRNLLKHLVQMPERQRSYHQLSRDIFYNTATRYIPADMTNHKKMSQFFTEPLRWEAVGIATIVWGPGCLGTGMLPGESYDIGPGKEPVSRALFGKTMVLNGSSCASFCEELGYLNDLLVWLIYENGLSTSNVYGDSNYLTWRRLGDSSSAIFAMGLHQDIKPSKDLPFFLVEVRKLIFARAYYTDKELGTFLGRPPRISQRYCICHMPLDLSAEEVGLESSELERAVSGLDPNGWNQAGKTTGATTTRAMLINSLFREEILELSLGPIDATTLTARADDISRRQEHAWTLFPPHLMEWRKGLLSAAKFPTGYLYLDRLYNNFLLQRTLVKFTRQAPTQLLHAARQMLITVLEGVSIRVTSSVDNNDMAWMVCIFGLPAGATLALDLLYQHQNPGGHKRYASLSRSETIQNLSVLTSSLGWIYKEGDGNFDLCSNARRVLQDILDHVLAPPELAAADPQRMHGEEPNETSNVDVSSSFVAGAGTDGLSGDLPWFDNDYNYLDNDFWMNLAEQLPDLGPS
ncbi:MAG: hypothetical protein Q9160_005992 [Pyrenula sp. 1 TL-2023]